MADQRDRDNRTRSAGAPEGDAIGRLLRLAGPRPEVPPEVRERVHAAVRGEWRAAVRRRRIFRWRFPGALAAAVVLAVALASRGPIEPAAPIATVSQVAAVDSAPAGGSFAPGDRIYAGDPIETGGYGVALAARNGLSLRLSAGTSASFASSGELILQAGRVYADTGDALFRERIVTVRTPVGSATDIGTRFAVEYLDGDMSVAVRHGRVDVAHRQESYTAAAGERLRIIDDTIVTFEEISPADSSWDWTAALAPAFDIESHTLLDFLKWAARETGKELVFENEDVRIATMGTRPFGSISDLTPTEAVHAVLPTTSFGYRMDEQQIVITAPAQ